MTSRAVRLAPHLPLTAACAGLSLANLVRLPGHALMLACAVGLGSALAGPRARIALLLVAALVGAWWLGSARLGALDRSVLTRRAGETELVRAVVTAPVRRGSFDLRVRATVERFGRLDLREDVLLKLPLGRAPPQGSRLTLVGRVTLPRPVRHGFDERAWLRRQGVHVVVHGRRWRIVGRRGGLAGIGDRLHERLARTIAPGVTGERRAVVAGIVLGEDEALSDELRDSFRASGLYHLLAVSGQNVAFLAGGMLALAWLLGVPRWLGEIGVLAAICGYVLAVGWQPSVVRAGVAGCLASLAWLSSRQRDRWHFLLVGAMVLLAWNPYSLLEPGFQLSFAAVAAIFIAVPRLERALEGYPVPASAAAALAVSAACGLVTAPILWLQFGAVPLFAVLANALAAPVVAPLLGLGLLTALVEPVAPPAAATLGYANGWLAAYLAAVCAARRRAAARPGDLVQWAGGARRAPRIRCGCGATPRPAETSAGRCARRRGPGCGRVAARPRSAVRRRPACASRSSTSARATRSSCRLPGGRCWSTRDRRRLASPLSSRRSASAGSRCWSSHILNATTSAAPQTCSRAFASTRSSTRGFRPTAATSRRRSPPRAATTCRS